MRKGGVLMMTLAMVAVAWTTGVTANGATGVAASGANGGPGTPGEAGPVGAELDALAEAAGVAAPLPRALQKDLWALERGMVPNTVALASANGDVLDPVPPNARCVIAQDDAGMGDDAGNDEEAALAVEPGAHAGCAGAHDIMDWYRITGGENNTLNATLVPPRDQDFDLYVTDCSGATLARSVDPAGETERAHVGFDHHGALCVGVDPYTGTGAYNLTLEMGTVLCAQNDAGSQRDSSYPAYPDWYDPDWPGRVTLDGFGTYSACYRYDAYLPYTWKNYLEVDGYRFDAVEGERVVVTLERENCNFFDYDVYDQNERWLAAGSNTGDSCDTLHRSVFTPGYSGAYVLNTRGRPGAYSVSLAPAVGWCPGDDAGTGADAADDFDAPTPVSDGPYTGCMDEVDVIDVYALPASAGDRVKVNVTLPGFTTAQGARFIIAYLYDDTGRLRVHAHNWNVGDENSTHTFALSTLVDVDSRLHLAFAAGYVGGNYSFAVDRDTGLDLAPLHVVNATVRTPGAMAVCDGDLLLGAAPGILRVTEDGLETHVDDPYNDYHKGLACDARGDLYSYVSAYEVYDEWGRLAVGRITGPDAGRPMVPGDLGALEFTADGALLVEDRPDPLRVDCATRRAEPMTGVGAVATFAHGPDGTLYGAWGGEVFSIHGNTTTVVAELPVGVNSLAFDALGRGYASQNGHDGAVYRFDPATGEVEPFATGAWGYANLQFHGTRLYMAQRSWWATGTMTHTLGYYDVGVPGVEGHQPACAMPWADLAVTAVEEVATETFVLFGVDTGLDDYRYFNATVTNLGPMAYAGTIHVRGYETPANCRWPPGTLNCDGRNAFWGAYIHDGLAPGESATVTLRWSALLALGDADLTFELEPLGEGDADPANNARTLRTHAHVEGYGGFL